MRLGRKLAEGTAADPVADRGVPGPASTEPVAPTEPAAAPEPVWASAEAERRTRV